MKKINKLLAVPLIALNLVSCINKDSGKINNSGVAEIPLSINGKQIIGQVIDLDKDGKVDGVFVTDSLGQKYLLKYKQGYQNSPEFREFYNPLKSKTFEAGERETLSKYLFLNNLLQSEKNKK